MLIPNRVKRFIEATHSFCVIMDGDRPAYIVAPFDWAERMFLGRNEDEELEELEDINSDINSVAEETRPGNLPAIEE